MIGHFPIPYADESLYSVCARAVRLLNPPSRRGFCESLFGPGAIAVIDFPSRLTILAGNLPPNHPVTAQSLLQANTLLPLFLPFLPKERAEWCRQAALGKGGKRIPFLTGVMASKLQQPLNLRLCPECATEEMRVEKQAYWHRSHQIGGITVCHRHGNLLAETAIRGRGRNNRHEFHCPPREWIPMETDTSKGDRALAKDAYWLLTKNTSEPGPDTLRENYTIALQERGFLHRSGRLHITQLLEQFIQFHGTARLEKIGCPLKTGQNSNWLADLLRGRPKCAHPVQHLLLIAFLAHSAESFFKILEEDKQLPRHEKVTPQETERPEREINPETLSKLWSNPLVSLREIGRQMRADPMTIKRHAVKAGLQFPRKAVRPTQKKPAGPKPKKSRLEHHKRRWARALARRSEPSMRARMSTSYNYLFHNDKEWLVAHRPPSATPKARKPRVDWKARDKQLAERVREMATGPTGIRSAGKIRTALGLGNMLRKKPEKLKKTIAAIQKLGGGFSKLSDEGLSPFIRNGKRD